MMMTFQFFLLIALSFKVVSTNTLPTNEEYLNITNLDEILQALEKQNFEVAKWRDLCLVLGIYKPTLNGIEATNQHHGVDRCLQECLSSWLSKADKVKQKGGPTWYSLIVGLRNIKEINTADKIHRNKHSQEHPACEIFERYTSDSSIQKNLLSLVNLLYGEKIVKKVLWPKDGRELLQHIGNSICVNYQILEAFGVVLQQSPVTMSIGRNILKEYKRRFPEKKDVTSSDNKNVHFVASSDLNFTKLRGEFADAIFDINQAMIDKPSLQELYQYLRWGYKHLRPHLRDCENRADILNLISEHSSLIDIGLLESIVFKFNIEEAKPAIQKYKENVNKFRQSLRHVLDEKFFHRHLLQSETITFSIDQDVDGITLKDVEKLIKAAFKEHAPCIRVHVISESNSFTVTCSFPLLLYEEINLAAMENIEALKEKGLQRLTIGFNTVYDKACEQQLDTEDDHCSQSIHSGRLEQMAIYISVKQLNEAHDKEDHTSTNSYLDMVSSVSSWLLILLILFITTIYVLVKPVLTDQKREAKSTQETLDKESQAHLQTNIEETEQARDTNDKELKRSDSDGADAAPHTWRHFKRAPKEVIIIGSFGNHEQWKLPGTIVSPKSIPVGLEGSYEDWIAEEIKSIVEIYEKNSKRYELKDIPEKGKSRQFYLDKIKSLFENCKKDEALIYYTGHGEKDTGNWCFKDGVISFNDIFELYMMHFRGKSLQIVSDCSYSGKWIHDCGKKLDEYGILSCGHKTREQKMLFKIFTSCQPHEEATLLTYSRKGMKYSEEDEGVVINYDEEIKMEPAQKGQNPMLVDFRHIHCYKMPGDQCELDSTCTWEDRLSKKRERIVLLVDNKHNKFPSWYYLLISEDAFDEFKGKQEKGNIGIEKVLYSGPGKNPPSDVKKKLNLRFDMNTYASYEYTDH
ncbi:PREDICTED: uncharacterized protein LOC109581770 isoform X2 [Amphimedon queenslandica]|uniref:Death domain-containing protein n=1 Tax=Amphimedon queenslandica TaxID=400682 RepID=A0AAN0J3Y5_AMPQE|nr:PREDICTED: uncharacterized protein LOC109581770 isoform X2 [Amphimedon queenslandica]|eukprot:XP_019851729.1 PREDICTED: uncharacterized protein LOC109581770 isoform X2 [Amphimedon queenslandica]